MTIPDYSMTTAPHFVGRKLGTSDWVTVDQECIDRFAACIGDRQWIHVDVERARRESPFGGPVAHGYLSLSLVAAMVMELGVMPPDAATRLNYGLDKVRFIAPVTAGARVRLRASLAAVEPQNGSRMLLKLQSTLWPQGPRRFAKRSAACRIEQPSETARVIRSRRSRDNGAVMARSSALALDSSNQIIRFRATPNCSNSLELNR